MGEYGRWFEIAKIRDIIKRLTDLEKLVGFEVCGDLFSFFGSAIEIEFLCDSAESTDRLIDLVLAITLTDLSESLLCSL